MQAHSIDMPVKSTRLEHIGLTEVQFGYDGRAVVRVDTLTLHERTCLGIFGPNGSGKTTLVRGMTGLLDPLAGSVTRRPGLRIGYLPQYRGIDLSWPMNGFDAAALATSARGRMGWVDTDARRRIHDTMRRLNVDALARRSFATLSGGQQQRLLLAGALAAEPHILVLDEPTDGLDVRSRQTLLTLLRELSREGLCTAIISHDVEDLLAICDSVAWLHPSIDAGEPSNVEIVTPGTLAERLLGTRAVL